MSCSHEKPCKLIAFALILKTVLGQWEGVCFVLLFAGVNVEIGDYHVQLFGFVRLLYF